jgi:hypothetical protein
MIIENQAMVTDAVIEAGVTRALIGDYVRHDEPSRAKAATAAR